MTAFLHDEVDRLHGRIDGTVTWTGLLEDFRTMAEFDRCHGNRASSTDNLQGLQGIGSGLTGNSIAGKGDKIVVIDKFLLVTEFLKAREDGCYFGLGEGQAQLLETSHHGVTPAVLGKRQIGAPPPHIPGIHDFVSLPHLEDTVLVDSGAVSKGILTYNRLATGNLQTAETADQA